MIYEIDKCYDFPVSPDTGPADDFFYLQVETPNGITDIPLKKLDFQKEVSYSIPATLHCRVKNINEDGLPVLTHNVAPYIYTLYGNTFERGEAFELEVVWLPENPADGAYTLRDKYGIFFRLNEPEGLLAKGQIVRCVFDKLTPRYFSLHRVDEGARLPFYAPADLFANADVDPLLRRFFVRQLAQRTDLANLRSDIQAKNPLWTLNAARAVLRLMPEWFLKAKLKPQNRVYHRIVEGIRRSLLYLLEGSSFLNAASAEHRRALQQQLTEMVESLEPFDTTLTLIHTDALDTFVERLLDKLQKSGYLFHPARQFAALMIIFRLHPEKVGYYLSRIFESIFGRDLENWKREPFRSAFVEQFEIYVRQARSSIDAMPGAETRQEKSRLETIIIAIALQLLLAPEDADLSRSWSLFYRYVSLLRPLNTEALLSKSFLTLMGADVNTRLTYEQLKEPMMMMTQATVLPAGNILQHLTTTHRYTQRGVELAISSEGICLRPEGRNDITERAIPDTLMPWLHTQVMVNGIKGLSGSRLRRLADHNQWWHDIENALFEQNPITETANERRRADIGDDVYIVFDSVDNSTDNPTFFCHIEDPDFVPANGFVNCDMIVKYKLKDISLRTFRTPSGGERGFLATVIGVDADGLYELSLRETVDSYIEEVFNYQDEYFAVITGDFSAREYSAICNLGIGLFLDRGDFSEHFAPGDIVRFRLKYIGSQGQLRGTILSPAQPEDPKFGKVEAFNYLMQHIGEDDASIHESNNEEEVMRDLDEILTVDHVRELIEIMRFKAIAETDLIKAYDLLRYARLLAMVIGDDSLASKFATHAALLTLHQFFAANSRIDAEKLEELQDECASDPLLKMIYHRLEMVSWLEKAERNTDLYATSSHPANELEGSIARMVLAYNMLQASESDDNRIASDIKQKIMEKLNVNNETRRGKYYGSESKYLEFKTSIVYPAAAPGEEVRENPAAQQFHILSRIAGLLNANGGRLYLGVNNDGFEVGMRDDFKYFERHPAFARNHRHKITSIDNMCVFIEDLVNEYFPASAARKISVSADDEAEKGVIVIDVMESIDPVFLEDRLFVRQSGQSTREYRGQDREDFERERADLKAERDHVLALAARSGEKNPDSIATKEENSPKETPIHSEEPTLHTNTVATSHWRPNILHEYENGYAEPFGYLYLTGEDEITFSTNDLYMETGIDGCRLALVIPHDMARDYLILAFDDEKALKVPLSEIYEHGENISLHHWNDTPLRFAAIARKDDGLLCISADSGNSLWRRYIRVQAIEQGHIGNQPKRIHEAPINHSVAFDIIDTEAISRFADCNGEKLGNKRFGVTLRVKEDSPNADFKLNDIFKQCSPSI